MSAWSLFAGAMFRKRAVAGMERSHVPISPAQTPASIHAGLGVCLSRDFLRFAHFFGVFRTTGVSASDFQRGGAGRSDGFIIDVDA